MSAELFLDRVARTGLLDDSLLAKVRKQIASSKSKITAEAVAKMLVKSGHLTKSQATKMLGEIAETRGPGGNRAVTRADEPPETIVDSPAGRNDELGMAPLDDEEEELALVMDDDEAPGDEDEVVMLEDASDDVSAGSRAAPPVETIVDSGLEPVGDSGAGLQPVAETGGLEPVEVAGGLEPIGVAGGLEPVADSDLQPMDDREFGGGDMQAPGTKPPPAGMRRGKTAGKKNQWDSKLLLVGGGGLAILVLAGIALYFSLTSGTAKEMFQAAEEDYRSQAFSQSIDKYEKFLKAYPNDANVSLARVKIGTARLWQTVEARDKTHALKAAKEVLPQIENEEAFSEVRAELASILPEIAEGFASQAKAKEDVTAAQELVDLAKEAMKLVNNPAYVPTSLRKSIQTRLDAIAEDTSIAERNINRKKRLTADVKAIREAADAGKTVEAFDIRKRLLQEYPGLEQHESLVEVVLLITERERDLVKVADEPLEALTEDHPTTAEFQVAIASRRGKGTGGDEKQMVFFLARGTVYGLHAATGRLAWRRSVGYETLISPRPISKQAGADVIAVDQRRNEVLRLKGETGELVWRLPVGEPFLEPVFDGKRLLVATESGKIHDVDVETGHAARHVTIPQSLESGPGIGQGACLYQVGEHSNLYVLDKATLECKEVYYLGHRPGTIVTPPIMILGHLFIAENSGGRQCSLHVMATDEDGLTVKTAMKPIRLTGRILVPPLVSASRLIVTTDLGEIRVLEVNTSDSENPLLDAVKPLVASFASPIISYAQYDAGQLWVGNDRFTLYEVQMSLNQISSKWIKNQRDTFVASPQVIGDTVYHLRRRKNSPAYTAAAIQGDDAKVLWEVDLAVPAALLAVNMQRQQVHCISSQAELFEITTDIFKEGHLDQPATGAVGAQRTVPFDELIPMDNERWAFGSPLDRRRIVLYDANAVSESSRLLTQPLKAVGQADVTSTPVYYQEGLLVPLDNGQVLLVDPRTGDSKALPFQPRVEAGTKVQWRRPAVVGDDFVIVDNRQKLYRVGLGDQGEARLEQRAQAELEMDIASPLAAAGDTVYGFVSGANSDTIVSCSAADLSVGKEWSLEGRVTWGPERIGDTVLVATDRDGLLCFEAGQKQRWKAPLAYGALAGWPLPEGDDLILTSLDGIVWRISGADGAEVNKTDVGQPLGSGAVVFAGRLLLAGADGTLFVIPLLPGA